MKRWRTVLFTAAVVVPVVLLASSCTRTVVDVWGHTKGIVNHNYGVGVFGPPYNWVTGWSVDVGFKTQYADADAGGDVLDDWASPVGGGSSCWVMYYEAAALDKCEVTSLRFLPDWGTAGGYGNFTWNEPAWDKHQTVYADEVTSKGGTIMTECWWEGSMWDRLGLECDYTLDQITTHQQEMGP